MVSREHPALVTAISRTDIMIIMLSLFQLIVYFIYIYFGKLTPTPVLIEPSQMRIKVYLILMHSQEWCVGMLTNTKTCCLQPQLSSDALV